MLGTDKTLKRAFKKCDKYRTMGLLSRFYHTMRFWYRDIDITRQFTLEPLKNV